MKKNFILNLIGMLLTVNQFFVYANPVSEFPVKVVEVKDSGISDRDETKSVIEIRWQTDSIEKEKIISFNIILFAVYADGTKISYRKSIDKNELSAQMEIPSVKTNGRRPLAGIKNLNAKVFALISTK